MTIECYHCYGPHKAAFCSIVGSQRRLGRRPSNPKCFNCGLQGHIAKECQQTALPGSDSCWECGEAIVFKQALGIGWGGKQRFHRVRVSGHFGNECPNRRWASSSTRGPSESEEDLCMSLGTNFNLAEFPPVSNGAGALASENQKTLLSYAHVLQSKSIGKNGTAADGRPVEINLGWSKPNFVEFPSIRVGGGGGAAIPASEQKKTYAEMLKSGGKK